MREETVEKEELSTETSNTGVLTPDINKSLTSFELEEEEGTCKVTSLRTGNWTDWLKTFGKNILCLVNQTYQLSHSLYFISTVFEFGWG